MYNDLEIRLCVQVTEHWMGKIRAEMLRVTTETDNLKSVVMVKRVLVC